MLSAAAATQLAIFYATESKILRRKVIPDHDAELTRLAPGTGESMLLLPLSQPYDDASCRAAIAAATGARPPSGRCCVVDDGGNIIGVCNADPALDTHPQGQLVISDDAGPGDRYVAGVFHRRYAVVSSATNIVIAAAWLPILGSPPGFSSEMTRWPEVGSYMTRATGHYLLPWQTLRRDDAAPADRAAGLAS